MTDKIDLEDLPEEDELEVLKQRADLLGIKYSKNVKLATLKAKIEAQIEEKVVKEESALTLQQIKNKAKEEQLKLVRIRLSLMNPMKKTWRGEVITVANALIGTVRKFIPFDPKFYKNGYHVPQCILDTLRERKFVNITTHQNGPRVEVEKEEIPEFSIEILPQLTPKELEDLAKEQRAGNRID